MTIQILSILRGFLTLGLTLSLLDCLNILSVVCLSLWLGRLFSLWRLFLLLAITLCISAWIILGYVIVCIICLRLLRWQQSSFEQPQIATFRILSVCHTVELQMPWCCFLKFYYKAVVVTKASRGLFLQNQSFNCGVRLIFLCRCIRASSRLLSLYIRRTGAVCLILMIILNLSLVCVFRGSLVIFLCLILILNICISRWGHLLYTYAVEELGSVRGHAPMLGQTFNGDENPSTLQDVHAFGFLHLLFRLSNPYTSKHHDHKANHKSLKANSSVDSDMGPRWYVDVIRTLQSISASTTALI